MKPDRSAVFLRAEWYESSAALWVERAQRLYISSLLLFVVGALLALFGAD
jgi:hypothetical protein